MTDLIDVQGGCAQIEIGIDKVGITNLILPLKIQTGSGVQNVVAEIDALGSLSKTERGAHMSRTARILNDCVKKTIDHNTVIQITKDLKQQLHSENINLKIKFTLFRKKFSPITKNYSYINYDCWINADMTHKFSMSLGTSVLITSLCPVSKSISKFGAHNQRGEVVVVAEILDNNFWFDNFIELIEKNSSSEMYGVLKREDEKFVTETAYKNPKIVEDIVRSIAKELRSNKKLGKWSVSCKNFESIHTHNAYAEIIGESNGRRN